MVSRHSGSEENRPPAQGHHQPQHPIALGEPLVDLVAAEESKGPIMRPEASLEEESKEPQRRQD